MKSKIKILTTGIPYTQPTKPVIELSNSTGKIVSKVIGEPNKNILNKIPTDPVDIVLLNITEHDIFSAIESSPILGPLVAKYPRHWQSIVLRRNPNEGMFEFISSSLISERENRAGFDSGYVKILSYIQNKYLTL